MWCSVLQEKGLKTNRRALTRVLHICCFSAVAAVVGCCCLHNVFKCIATLSSFTCWLISHCSSSVPRALPLLLRSAAWLCALHVLFQPSLLLHTADHSFSPTGSCCARAASVVAQSLLRGITTHTLLPTSILCDQAEFWS